MSTIAKTMLSKAGTVMRQTLKKSKNITEFTERMFKPTLESSPKEGDVLVKTISEDVATVSENKPRSIFSRIITKIVKNKAPNKKTNLAQAETYTSKAEPFPQMGGLTGSKVYTKDGKYLGNCAYADSIIENSSMNNKFPISWIDPKTNCPKSYIFVNGIETTAAGKGKGNGREIMKRLYLQSVENGHEGRIRLLSVQGSSGFYEKLGFENGQDVINNLQRKLQERLNYLKAYWKTGDFKMIGFSSREALVKEIQAIEEQLAKHEPCQDMCYLYFTPTKENLAKLFSK